MILAFKFINITENGVLERILERTLAASSCRGRLVRKGDETVLYAESETTDVLERFADTLAISVPHSIFMKEYCVEVVETMPNDVVREAEICKPEAMPPCPKCLADVENTASEKFGNIFTHCKVCGYPVEPTEVTLINFAKEMQAAADANHTELFEALARVIHNGGSATLTTMSGTVTAAALTKKNIGKFPVDEIIAYDVHTASRFFEMQKGEVLALGSIEKPRIRMQMALEFKEKYPFFYSAFAHVKLPDDMVLFLLMRALHEVGDVLFYLSRSVDPSTPIALTFASDTAGVKALDVVVTEEGDAIVASGERSILPWRGRGYGKKSLSLCGDYAGLMEKTSAEVVQRERLAGRDIAVDELLVAEGEEAPDTGVPVVRFSHRHAAFFSVLGQHGLLGKKMAGIYVGKTHDSAIMIHSEKFGLVDFMRFDFEYETFDALFSAIEAMNETGGKLLANFQQKFPEVFEGFVGKRIERNGSNVMTLFGVIGMILGFGETTAEASRKLLDNAAEFKGKKGPRIDYKLKGERRLDPLWSVRTAMSFKLAGLDDLTLSFGVVESFSEFLSSTIDDIETDMGLDGVVLCGSLFGEKKILQKSHMLIAKNHTVYFNKALPLDEISTAYGALMLTV
ncbi:hypothetical protein [Hydrogenimonas sp.]